MYKQKLNAAKPWFEETWPAIQDEARCRTATVYFGDESSVRSDFHRGTTCGIRGDTLVVTETGRYFIVNFRSAVSSNVKLRIMVTDSRVNVGVFIASVKRLLRNTKRSIYLVVDIYPTHIAKKVRNFMDVTQGKLKVYYLPSYSQGLNPDELVCNRIKTHHLGRIRSLILRNRKNPSSFRVSISANIHMVNSALLLRKTYSAHTEVMSGVLIHF